MKFKGGFGSVLALVDTYYTGQCLGLPNDFVPARVHIIVQGRGVYANGETNVVVPGRTRGWVRSEPVFGFGFATMTCQMYSIDSNEHMFGSKTKVAFLVGPIILG